MSGERPDVQTDDRTRVADLVSFLAVNLVENPDAVRVEVREESDRMMVLVNVDPEDRGEFIGRGGQTARAMRTLLSAIGARFGLKLDLEIVD